MAITRFYENIDLTKSKLFNFIPHPISSADKAALSSTLTALDKGFTVYDTDLLCLCSWTGTEWKCNTEELDPIWNAEKTNYFTKAESDLRYLQSYTETDPIWTSEKSNYYTKLELQTPNSSIIDWTNLVNVPSFPDTNFANTDLELTQSRTHNAHQYGWNFLSNSSNGAANSSLWTGAGYLQLKQEYPTYDVISNIQLSGGDIIMYAATNQADYYGAYFNLGQSGLIELYSKAYGLADEHRMEIHTGKIQFSKAGSYSSLFMYMKELPNITTSNIIYYNPVDGRLTYGALPQVDLSSYYTKTELQTSGQSSVNWGNITNAPSFITGVTADNGLTASTSTNVQLGGTLSKNTTISTGSLYKLTISGSEPTGTNGIFNISQTASSGNGIYAVADLTNGAAVYGHATSGQGVSGTGITGVFGSSTSGNGVWGQSSTGRGGIFITTNGASALSASASNSSTNSISGVLMLERKNSGTSANGIGASIDYYVQTTVNYTQLSNQLISKWTDVNDATRTSQFIIKGVNSAVNQDLLTLNGSGQLQLNKYGSGTFTGSPIKYAAFSSTGLLLEAPIPGPAGANTQIQYNDNGAFGASSNWTYDSVAGTVTLNGNINASKSFTNAISGVGAGAFSATNTYNQANLVANSGYAYSAGLVSLYNIYNSNQSIGVGNPHSANMNYLRLNTAPNVSVSVVQAVGERAISANATIVSVDTLSSGVSSISHVASYQIYPIQQAGGSGVTSLPTITNYYGLLIGNQGEYANMAAKITNRYALYQAGATDKNYFNGPMILKNIANAAGTKMVVVAADGTLASQDIPTGTGGSNDGNNYTTNVTYASGILTTSRNGLADITTSLPFGSYYTKTELQGTGLAQVHWNNITNAPAFLTSYTETDPVFVASPAYGITSSNITNWNAAYGWGNHALAGYLTSFTETDPVWTSEKVNYYTITQSNAAYAPISGSGNYIQNQNTSAQTGNFWMEGQGKIQVTNGASALDLTHNTTGLTVLALRNNNAAGGVGLRLYNDSGAVATQLWHGGTVNSTSPDNFIWDVLRGNANFLSRNGFIDFSTVGFGDSYSRLRVSTNITEVKNRLLVGAATDDTTSALQVNGNMSVGNGDILIAGKGGASYTEIKLLNDTQRLRVGGANSGHIMLFGNNKPNGDGGVVELNFNTSGYAASGFRIYDANGWGLKFNVSSTATSVYGKLLVGNPTDDGASALQIKGNTVGTGTLTLKQDISTDVISYNFKDSVGTNIGSWYVNPPYNRMTIANYKAGGFISYEVGSTTAFVMQETKNESRGRLLVNQPTDDSSTALQVNGNIKLSGVDGSVLSIAGNNNTQRLFLGTSGSSGTINLVGDNAGTTNNGGLSFEITTTNNTSAQYKFWNVNNGSWLSLLAIGASNTTLSTNLTISKLATSGTAPTTTGTTKMVITDQNGLLSFADIPTGGAGSDTNLGNTDLTLTANRTITGGNFSLNMSGLSQFKVLHNDTYTYYNVTSGSHYMRTADATGKESYTNQTPGSFYWYQNHPDYGNIDTFAWLNTTWLESGHKNYGLSAYSEIYSRTTTNNAQAYISASSYTNATPFAAQGTFTVGGIKLQTRTASNGTWKGLIIDLSGNVKLESVTDATGDFVTIDGTGILRKRTAAEVRADIGAQASGSYLTSAITGIGTSGNIQTGATQTLAIGTSGTDFNIASSGNIHTFNIPDAGTSSRGLVTSTSQTFGGDKTFSGNLNIGSGTYFFPTVATAALTWAGTNQSTNYKSIIGPTSNGLGVANTSYITQIIGNSSAQTTASSGTHNFMAQIALRALTATANATTPASITNAATLYIEGAATGTANIINNYALWVNNGESRFDGRLTSSTYLVASTQATLPHFDVFETITSLNSSIWGINGNNNLSHYGRFNGSWISRTLTASSNHANWVFGDGSVTKPPSGTVDYASNVAIKGIVINTGAGAVTNGAALYIDGASTGATNNYSIIVNSGTTKLGGALNVDNIYANQNANILISAATVISSGNSLSVNTIKTVGNTDDLLIRSGAVSGTTRLQYWSTTGSIWTDRITIAGSDGALKIVGLSTDNTATQVLGKDASGNSVWRDISSISGGGGGFTPSGTASQYIAGDGTYVTFPTNVSVFTNDSGYLTSASSLNPANISQTATYRFVSDTEKSTWNGKQNAITTGTTAQYLRGDLSLATFPTALSSFTNDSNFITISAVTDSVVTGKVLTGYIVGTNTALAATDTILAAMGKIQGQLNNKQASGSYLTANQTITLSGDVSGSGTTAITASIGTNKVTNTQLAQMAANTIKGNNTAGLANALDLTVTQVKTMLALNNVENTALSTWTGSTAITTLGTIASGTWNAGIIAGQYGGTGVNNSGKTITLGGNLTTSGAFATTLTVTAATNVTLPTSGTLATTSQIPTNNNTLTNGAGYITASSTDTLTNKRINSRINSIASTATPTPNADSDDTYIITALAVGATFGAPTGTPVDGQKLIIRIHDNGSSQTIGFNAIYRFSSDMAAPTATVAGKMLYLGFMYNSVDAKWDCIAQLGNF